MRNKVHDKHTVAAVERLEESRLEDKRHLLFTAMPSII